MRRYKSIPLALVVFTLSSTVFGLRAAAEESRARIANPLPESVLRRIRLLPIQHNGRTKPFDSFAREALEQVTGNPEWKGQDPAQTMASLMVWPDIWGEEEILSIPFVPLREAIGMDAHKKRTSMNELLSTRKLMKLLPAIVQKQQRDEKLSMLENETMDAFGRFSTLTRIFSHDVALVPPHGADTPVWVSVTRAEGYSAQEQDAIRQTWNAFILAVREGEEAKIAPAFDHLQARLHAANPAAVPAHWRLNLEVFYNHVRPFTIARWIYVLAVVLLLVSLVRNAPSVGRVGIGVFVLAAAVHGGGIALRVILSRRPPVANFYETMLWLPFVAVVTSLVFERLYHARYFTLASAILAAMVLTLSSHVPLDSSITPIVAVLRSNYWLTVHVLTIVASYGALALAVVLAHIDGVMFLSNAQERSRQALGFFVYRTLQVGVVLLASGIMLGAVWANASWGRYWGWDPKETWALITLLWYLALLHGRFAGWLRGVGVSLATIAGFFLLLMTYYGVSFYLVGLHSYAGGNAKPLPVLLIGYVIAELSFLGVVAASAVRRGRLA